MAVNAEIDGIRCTLEMLADGSIRVVHESLALNAMHGPGTGGIASYIVHPAQRQQYEHLSSLLPPDQRRDVNPDEPRPWWSYTGKDKKEEASD